MSGQSKHERNNSSDTDPKKQVRLTNFDNEPMALMAEQRLRQEGIRCYVKSLRGGPGLWGSAYNLPHTLYVHQGDEMEAREILDLVPLEVVERGQADIPPRKSPDLWVVLGGIFVAALALAILIPLASRAGG